MLADRGAVVVDADAITREVQSPDGAAYDAIVARFSSGIVASDGSIDRPALAAIVFSDPAALHDLEAIVHPAVGTVIVERLAAEAGTDHVVILDVPLMVEKGTYVTEGLIVVDCPVDVAVRRLVAQRGMAEDDARRRMAAQVSREERLAKADFVIDNSGSVDDLNREVDRAWGWVQQLGEGRRRHSDENKVADGDHGKQ